MLSSRERSSRGARMDVFDPSTGQVFFETTTQVQSMVAKPPWYIQCRGRKQDPKTYRSPGSGPASLREMALRSCVWNIGMFYPEDFKEVPWPISKQLYQKMKETDTLSGLSWSIFRDAYPGEEEISSGYQFSIPSNQGSPPLSIPSINAFLPGFSFNHITILSISSLGNIIAEDLMSIHIPSLAVLAIENKGPIALDEMDSRFMRVWCRAMHEKRTCQKLRVLSLRGFEVDQNIFLQSLSTLPELALVNVFGFNGQKPFHKWSESWEFLPRTIRRCPEKIWVDPDLTTSEKLDILYKGTLAPDRQPKHAGDSTHESVISIQYGSFESLAQRHSIWFARLPDLKEKDHGDGKQKMLENSKDEGAGPPSKKRKIRAGKQQSLGSLLGGFA